MSKFLRKLGEIGACRSARFWTNGFEAHEAMQNCRRADWMLWITEKIGHEKLAVKLAVACAKSVRHVLEQCEVDLTLFDEATTATEGWLVDPTEDKAEVALEAAQRLYKYHDHNPACIGNPWHAVRSAYRAGGAPLQGYAYEAAWLAGLAIGDADDCEEDDEGNEFCIEGSKLDLKHVSMCEVIRNDSEFQAAFAKFVSELYPETTPTV